QEPKAQHHIALGLAFMPPTHGKASLARVRLTISVSDPSGLLTRYMPGHFGSGTMRGSNLARLRLSVTLCGFCPPDIPMGAVTLRTASVATPGRVTAILIGIPRSRARCAATLQRGLQKRAVQRCGLNCEPQAKQVALMPPPIPCRPSGPRAIFGVTQPKTHQSCGRAEAPELTGGMSAGRIGESPCRFRGRPRADRRRPCRGKSQQ